MIVTLRLTEETEYDLLVDILRDAEVEGCEKQLHQLLAQSEHTSYLAIAEGEVVGGATLKWQENESELIYLATIPQKRKKGYGKAIIRAILSQMSKRGYRELLVGTGNYSFPNIVFYQKCGFRMDHVRRDYFAYVQPLRWRDGIALQDMIMFRYAGPIESIDAEGK